MDNVFQRMSKVMADITYLAKDDEVETGNGRSYKAITEEKVTTAVRAALIKHGLVVFPVKQTRTRTDERVIAYDKYRKCDVEKINRIVSVDVDYRIQNIDDPEDYVIAVSSGEGVDTQDKGVGKAMTYSYKYLLLRSFSIPTGEDADKISSDLYTDNLLGTKEFAKRNAEVEFKPNVYDKSDLIQKIHEAGARRGHDESKVNAWVEKNKGVPIELLEIEDLLDALRVLER